MRSKAICVCVRMCVCVIPQGKRFYTEVGCADTYTSVRHDLLVKHVVFAHDALCAIPKVMNAVSLK